MDPFQSPGPNFVFVIFNSSFKEGTLPSIRWTSCPTKPRSTPCPLQTLTLPQFCSESLLLCSLKSGLLVFAFLEVSDLPYVLVLHQSFVCVKNSEKNTTNNQTTKFKYRLQFHNFPWPLVIGIFWISYVLRHIRNLNLERILFSLKVCLFSPLQTRSPCIMKSMSQF